MHRKKVKDIKREQSIRLFKIEKDGKDGKVVTCVTHRRRQIVDRRQKEIRKRITNAAYSNSSKLKRMVRIGRCLLVEHVGENGSSIGVPDCKI